MSQGGQPGGPARPPSMADALRAEWSEIYASFGEVIDRSTVSRRGPDPEGMVYFAPTWRWGPDDPAVVQLRHDVLDRFGNWIERLRLLFRADLPEIAGRISDAEEFFRSWMERKGGWDVPTDIDRAMPLAAERLVAFTDLLDQVASTGTDDLFLVVDTNSLLRCPEFARYGDLYADPVTLVFVPAVVSELDDLKDRGRTPDVRDKAAKIITRYKGLRDRGSMLKGVKVAGTTTAMAIPTEPDFSRLPTWLDATTPDDRIIASVLTLQAAHPRSTTVLVTGDINLLNKADYAGIPTTSEPATTP